MGSFWRSFRALVHRNAIYRKRKWVSSIFEFALPALSICILLGIKAAVKDSDSFKATAVKAHFPSNDEAMVPFSFLDYVTALQAERKCISNDDEFEISGIPDKGFDWPVPFVKCDSRRCNFDGEDAVPYCQYNVLALAPSDDGNTEKNKDNIQEFASYIEERYPQVKNENNELHFDAYSFITEFQSESELEDYVTHEDYGDPGRPKIAVAVVFSSAPGASEKSYTYEIRVNSTNYNAPEEELEPGHKTTPPTDRNFRSFTKTDEESCEMLDYSPNLGTYQDSCTGQYYYNGAITIQRLVDDWIIYDATDENAKERGYKVAENGVTFVSFPSKEYEKDGFYAQISTYAPLFIFLGLIFPFSACIRSITLEKELRQKELLKMMSVSEGAIGWSWFVSLYSFFFFSAIVTAAASYGMYESTSFGFHFIFWQLSFLASITFASAIAAIFSKSTRAVLVGLLVYFIGFILALSLNYEEMDVGALSWASIHPVTALSFGLMVMGDLEDSKTGVNSNTYDFSDLPSGYAFSNAVGSLIGDCFIFGILTWYLNRVVRGDFGTPLPWYFPVTKQYWCPQKIRDSRVQDSEEESRRERRKSSFQRGLIEPVSDALKEQEKEGRSIEIRNLTKQFGTKTAIDDLSLSMYSGQVTALLGHNGAGKTTCINVLTGMVEPTSGYATIAGKDIRTQMGQIREDIGICPQHDCLFPLLTVKEHLEFFATIKGIYGNKPRSQADAEVKTAIEDVALFEKRNTLSKDLSGGMKRKLSVAIAFCGGSKVVYLDEPTSGMDPFSRRFTWNVIRQYREDRCIILTSHFMDEADLLGDRIAIMAEGQLRCVGSSLFLKKAFGVGYQLVIEKKAGKENQHQEEIEDKLVNLVKGTVKKASLLSDVGTEMSFQIPLESSENFAQLFKDLDKEVEQQRIVTYGISITTLDEVFLMVARGHVGEKSTLRSSVMKFQDVKETDTEMSRSHRSLTNLDDRAVFSRHVQALFAKRAMNFKRDKKAWCCSTILPAIFTLIGFLMVKFLPSWGEGMEPLTLSISENNPEIAAQERNPIPFNEDGSYTCQPGQCAYNQVENFVDSAGTYQYCGLTANINSNGMLKTCEITEADDFITQITEDGAFEVPQKVTTISNSSQSLFDSSTVYAASLYGGLYFSRDSSSIVEGGNGNSYNDEAYETCMENLDSHVYITEDQCANFKGIGYVVSYNFTSLHSSLIYQALADQAIIREANNNDDVTITAVVNPLPLTYAEESYAKTADAVAAWFLLVMSFPFISGAFATFIVAERLSKAKHLQTVAGVKPEAYWVSTYLWDIMNYQLPVWIVIILMFAFDLESFTTRDRGVVGGVILTLLLYGPASAGFTYCITFLFKSPSMCSLFTIMFNLIIGMVGPMITLNFRFFSYNPDDGLEHLGDIGLALEWILRIIPSFSLGKGLIYANFIDSFAYIYDEPDLTVWTEKGVLIDVIFLAVQSFLYIWLAIRIDKLSTKPRAVQMWKNFATFITCRCCCGTKSKVTHQAVRGADTPDDEDVVAEVERVRSGGANDELVVLNELTKRYDDGTLAVDHMTLGIPHGQCFGLLGINGAGKTTTMAMLTAEFPPTSGDATLAGFSVTKEPEQTRRRIGYCPQFDAHFMNMTGREHVELYASIKGVPKEVVKEAAAAKLAEVGLEAFDSDRLSSQYSGGMKRKLSVACATIGRPDIVFLDEPSTGMDPVARRDLWQVISDMVIGEEEEELDHKTSVILTTHSMEECEALCPRIGIMAGGKLRCLGSAQHLKSRFGKGFQCEVKVQEVHSQDADYQSTLMKLCSHIGEVAAPRRRSSAALTGSQVQHVEEDTGDVEDGSHRPAEATYVNLSQARALAELLTGNASISSMITSDDPRGYVAFKNALSDVGLPLDEFAVFCVEELRIQALLCFFEERFADCILRERQENKIRYEVPSEGLKISSLFATIEENKEKLMLADYGVSQTTLEQVFNMHAAEAEKAKHIGNAGNM